MEALGVNLSAPRAKMLRSIRENGIAYFHAPFYHPAIAPFQKLRRTLKIKTLFNLLGPLNNPLVIKRQVAGVSDLKTFRLYCAVLKKMNLKRALLVHSPAAGLDEISTSAPTEAALIEGKSVKRFKILPQKLGVRKSTLKNLQCHSLKQSKAAALKILQGQEKGPAADVILINAGAAIWAAGKAPDLKHGIRMARQSLNSGSAYKALKGLVRISNS